MYVMDIYTHTLPYANAIEGKRDESRGKTPQDFCDICTVKRTRRAGKVSREKKKRSVNNMENLPPLSPFLPKASEVVHDFVFGLSLRIATYFTYIPT